MDPWIFPAPLCPGDPIAVVAPSSPFPRADFLEGLAWLRDRYDVRCSTSIFEREGYLAGSDERRGEELAAALQSGVRAVIAARGGFGLTRIVERTHFEDLRRRPVWLVGFSDPTAWHVEATRVRVASIHGPNVTGLGLAVASPRVRASWLRALERPHAVHAWEELAVVRRGDARGRVVGGNLSLVAAMAAAGRLKVPDGLLILLEDVTERPYRVDRMLTSLRVGGYFARASGVVFGGFTSCDAGPDGILVEEVLDSFVRAVKLPALRGAPFGHVPGNEAFVVGANARLEGGSLVFEPAT